MTEWYGSADDESKGLLPGEDENEDEGEVTPTGSNSWNPLSYAAGAATALKDTFSAYTGLAVDHTSSPPQTDDVDSSFHARLLNAGSRAKEIVGNAINQLTPDRTRTHAHPRTFEIDGIPCHQWQITNETTYKVALAAQLTSDIKKQLAPLNPSERTYAWSVCMHADRTLWFMPSMTNSTNDNTELSLKFGRPDSWKITDDVPLEGAIKLDNEEMVPNQRLRWTRGEYGSYVAFIDDSNNDDTIKEFDKVQDRDGYFVRPDHEKYHAGNPDEAWANKTLTLAETVWYTCRDAPTFAVYHPDHRCVWKDAAFKEKGNALRYRQLITSKFPKKVQGAINWEKGKDKNGNLNKNKVVSIVWDSRPDNSKEYGEIKSKILGCKDVPPCAPRNFIDHEGERWCLVFDADDLYFCPYENEFMKAKYGPTSHLARVAYETMVEAIDKQHVSSEEFVALKSATVALGVKRAAQDFKLKINANVVHPIVDNVVRPTIDAVGGALGNAVEPVKAVYDTAHHVVHKVKTMSLNPFEGVADFAKLKALVSEHKLMWACTTVALQLAARHFKIEISHTVCGLAALVLVDMWVHGGESELLNTVVRGSKAVGAVVAATGAAAALGGTVALGPAAFVSTMLSSAGGAAAVAKTIGNKNLMSILKTILEALVKGVGTQLDNNSALRSLMTSLVAHMFDTHK